MPKKVDPIIINNTDAVVLDQIISGNTACGENVLKRAQAIKQLAAGTQIKDVAANLSMRENTITEIRRRFLEHGIDSLNSPRSPGRPQTYSAKDAEAKLDALIAEALAEGKAVPNVKDVAAAINVPEAVVREMLKKREIVKSRQSTWDFESQAGFQNSQVDIVGFFISESRQFMIVAVRPMVSPAYSSQDGTIRIYNRGIAEEIANTDKSEGMIQLSEALKIAGSSEFKGHKRASKPLEFILSVLESLPDREHADIHLFSCGETLAENGNTLIKDVQVHYTQTKEQWMTEVEELVGILSSGSRSDREVSIAVIQGIYSYLRQSASRGPFEWSRSFEPRGNPATQEESTGTVSPGTIEFTARIMGDDGQWITSRAIENCHINQAAFQSVNLNDYMKAFDKLEQGIVRVSREAARRINEQYLVEVVKKR